MYRKPVNPTTSDDDMFSVGDMIHHSIQINILEWIMSV